MNEETGKLTIRFGEHNETYELVPPCGYSVDPEARTVRVWDKDATYLIGTAWLIALELPNSVLKPNR
jgi:hypothetical protein